VSVVTYVPAVAYSCAAVVAANTAKAILMLLATHGPPSGECVSARH